jgi:STE24 endopeptidase
MSQQGPSLAKKYHSIKNRLFFASLILNIFILVFFFFSGLSFYLKNQSASLFSQVFLINGFYIIVFCLVFYFVDFPLGFYEGFILEHKFKLSNQSFLNWLKDNLKKSGLELVLSLVLIEAAYFFLSKNGNFWWLWAGIFWIFITLILAKITPLVIIPIFYKYLPISDQQLKQRIFLLFDKCRIKIKDVTSINFSQKTKKANAFVCGLGKNKKVVLSDTLIANFSEQEIEGVVSHELGHYVNHDIFKLIIFNSVFTFAGLYLVDKILKGLIPLLGLKGIDDIAFLPLVALSLILLGFVILPVQNGFSRYLETRADLFSLKLTGNKSAFISMMGKLGSLNLADFSPSKFIEVWFHDHPPIAKRIKLAQDYKTG